MSDVYVPTIESFIDFTSEIEIANESINVKSIVTKVVTVINNIINKIRQWIVAVKKKALGNKEVYVIKDTFFLVKNNINWINDVIENVKFCNSKEELTNCVSEYEKICLNKFGKILQNKNKSYSKNISIHDYEKTKMSELLSIQEKILKIMENAVKEVKKIGEDDELVTIKCNLIQKACIDYYKAVNITIHSIKIRNIENAKNTARNIASGIADKVKGVEYLDDFDDDFEFEDDFDD